MRHHLLPPACLLTLAAVPLLSSCAAGPQTTGAETSATPTPPPAPAPRPTAAGLQLTAPGEIVSDAVRTIRATVVGDMLRLGTIVAVEQGPVGTLRTAVGETFHTSSTRNLQYPRLALAYAGWTAPGETPVIELWERGQKIGEFAGGAFLIDPDHTTPVACTGPGLAGICGYAPGAAPDTQVARPQGPTPARPASPTIAETPTPSRGHGGFHVNAGLGAGAADITCEVCDLASNTALSGYLGVGAAVGETTVLGVEGTGWASNEPGTDAKVYSLMATLTNYLDSQSGIFLTAGVGLIGYRQEADGLEQTASTIGYSGRLGYEVRTAGRLTFAPYIGFISTFGATVFKVEGSRVGEYNFNNLQAGVAVGIN